MKRRYKCEITGHDCTFDSDFWEYTGTRGLAESTCPAHRYEASDDDTGEIGVLNDFCRHAKDKPQRGRRRADYKCAVTGRVCPFNEADTWQWGQGNGDGAKDNCPVQAYEKERENYTDENGVYHITSDYCKHLLDRDGGA